MISIITPFYQSEEYLEESIKSVLNQQYEDFELILINDGSTDQSKDIALSFNDPRIRYYEQENRGVSFARNIGLKDMKGDFFCFLDADDRLTPNSLSSRLSVFESDPSIMFVDGRVIRLEDGVSIYKPEYKGNPFNELLTLSGRCFFGITWMIRKEQKHYNFNTKMTHAEDLLFYISLAAQGLFSFTPEAIYEVRTSNFSAMSNIKMLDQGYQQLYKEIALIEGVTTKDLSRLRRKIKSIMFKSYISKLSVFSATKVLLR